MARLLQHEHRRSNDVFGAQYLMPRDLAIDLGFGCVAPKRRRNSTRTDQSNADAFIPQLPSKDVSKGFYCVFCRRVLRLVWKLGNPRNRPDHKNVAGAVLAKVGKGGMRAMHDPANIGSNQIINNVWLYIGKIPFREDAGIGKEDVNTTKVVDRGLDHTVNSSSVRDIRRKRNRKIAELLRGLNKFRFVARHRSNPASTGT